MNRDTLKAASLEEPKPMSVQDFTEWGLTQVAYIKPIEMDGRTIYGVFAANGQKLGLVENLNAAHAALFENDLEPVALH
jgi:hypothetical protein